MKRLISAAASDVAKMTREDLKQAIVASEGRCIMSETIVAYDTVLRDISNPEVAKASGADMVLLNFFDTLYPTIVGLPKVKNPVKLLKSYIGIPVGCNLEPVDMNRAMLEDRISINKGRQATVESFEAAEKLGLDYICLTGNPGVGVSNQCILDAIKVCREHFNGLIIAGKMHGAGVKEKTFDLDLITKFIDAGADIILMPAVNTVPGVSEKDMREAVNLIHSKGALALASIGTSQESADVDTLRTIALTSKRCGIDIHHIGDVGFSGVSFPENIMAYGTAIKGRFHVYHRMAQSIRR